MCSLSKKNMMQCTILLSPWLPLGDVIIGSYLNDKWCIAFFKRTLPCYGYFSVITIVVIVRWLRSLMRTPWLPRMPCISVPLATTLTSSAQPGTSGTSGWSPVRTVSPISLTSLRYVYFCPHYCRTHSCTNIYPTPTQCTFTHTHTCTRSVALP